MNRLCRVVVAGAVAAMLVEVPRIAFAQQNPPPQIPPPTTPPPQKPDEPPKE